ncbi:uncharacterized protein LOC108742278 isoform X2 [Agrilus planipennis]|uniref:Uncharacterized protein LOC108742278 isoform X2 n=1 Tax=Agrilus planipennis TaxID=224129 RepID=A0A1W4X9Y4_AGRPL|nr:uncharacterized protein LOC108742278 isoform X2 [Agrilus planipennis]
MAKRLTEEMVIARTKISDLSKIRRLNCWGSELVDVSLLQKMPNVEVLSLSINKINSLADFQCCLALQELYIRQNDIRDLNQICYLQGLANLRNLWLAENPCSFIDGYRLTVIRALPQLQKLDNIAITQEEVRDAARKGRILTHPEDPHESEEEVEEEEYVPDRQQYSRYPTEQYQEQQYSPQRSPSRQETEYDNGDIDGYYIKEESLEDGKEYITTTIQQNSSRRQEQIRRSYSPTEYDERKGSQYYEQTKQTQFYEKTSLNTNSLEEGAGDNLKDLKLVTSQSSNSIKDYTNGERYPQSNPAAYRQTEGSEISSHSHEVPTRRERFTCPAAHQPPFNRRPVTRNSNILSAVLCLVKELDYPSLEVVEMAVRCRMDEFEE